MSAVDRLDVSVFTIPTEEPESDGTLEWDATTCVVVEASAGGRTGIGYTYGPAAAAALIHDVLRDRLLGIDPMDVERAWWTMAGALRNAGRPGIGTMAVSAVDVAMWDLKARLLGVPLADLIGRDRDDVRVYGSGGFTSMSVGALTVQLAGWAEQGIPAVKMKVGRRPQDDVGRVRAAREAVGDATVLMVDANGAYDRVEALGKGHAFADLGVAWFEEPVSSDDREGLRFLRDRLPPPVEVAAGEYASDHFQLRDLLPVVDVLQADATRCGGITGFLRAGPLCEAAGVPLSAHTAPTIHGHVGVGVHALRDVEYFHDHVRVEGMLFEGALRADEGVLRPDRSRPGMGLELKRADAERFAA